MAARALVSVVLSVLAVPAFGAIAPPPGLAFNMRPSADEEPAFRLVENGVRVYECRQALTDPDRFHWAFVTPDATLNDPASGHDVATARAIDQWNSMIDLSSVSAVLRATQESSPGDLPWAYMRAIPTSPDGMFAGVTSIQRVNTRGGAAPGNGCNADTAGSEARVPFTAEYYFYKRRGTA
ncbi:MAG TPA: DUF3455 domain-containing protein [Usitatibacter sp.]|jgi:hypothetical protein|nr:DUF3455 domain-containing protein [Usitatibacter sp.]